jgi:hypothetical protein
MCHWSNDPATTLSRYLVGAGPVELVVQVSWFQVAQRQRKRGTVCFVYGMVTLPGR